MVLDCIDWSLDTSLFGNLLVLDNVDYFASSHQLFSVGHFANMMSHSLPKLLFSSYLYVVFSVDDFWALITNI